MRDPMIPVEPVKKTVPLEPDAMTLRLEIGVPNITNFTNEVNHLSQECAETRAKMQISKSVVEGLP